MKNICVTINGEEKNIIITGANYTDAIKADVQSVVDYATPEERVEIIPKFIRELNDAFKAEACASIVENFAGDIVKGVLSRVTYSAIKYNAVKNTLGFYPIAEKSGVPVFVEFLDVVRYVNTFNKALPDGISPVKITGEFRRENWALLVIARNAILGRLSANDADKVAEIADKFASNPEMTKALKGFRKLRADGMASISAQQEILDYFYAQFNAKTGKTVKATAKHHLPDGTAITAFEAIQNELRKVKSLTKTIRDNDERAFMGILCNMYVTSEQAWSARNAGEATATAIAALEKVKTDSETLPVRKAKRTRAKAEK